MTTTQRSIPRPWSTDECALVRAHYATGDLHALAAQLGRSLTQVMAKANHLGVERTAEARRLSHTVSPDTQSIREALMQMASARTGTRVEEVANALHFRHGRVDAVAQNMQRTGHLFKARLSHRHTRYFTDPKLAAAANKMGNRPARPKPGTAVAAAPTVTIVRSTRGPAYLPGDPVITPATRWTIAPPPPARTLRTNTHMLTG